MKIEQTMTPDLERYINKIAKHIPGGVECHECGTINTYIHKRLKWKTVAPNRFEIRQFVECDKCGHLHQYGWIQDFNGPTVTTETIS